MVKEKIISDPGRKINVSALPTTFHAVFSRFDPNAGNQEKKFKGTKSNPRSDSAILSLNGYCGETEVQKVMVINDLIELTGCGKMTFKQLIIKANQFSHQLFEVEV